MVRSSRTVPAGLAGVLVVFPFLSAAQTNSSTVDYVVVSPGYTCTRIPGGGIGPHTAQFTATGWNAGPNAVPENRTGDDIPLGEVPVAWAMPDTVFDAHSGLYGLTESPDGPYGSNWNVVATLVESFDLTGAGSAALEFWHHYDIAGGFDFGYLEVMSSTGWTVLLANNGTLGGPEDFRFVSIDLAPYLGETVRFRFRVDTDLAIFGDGWVIDDVVVRIDGVDVFTDDLESGLGNWAISSQWGLTLPSGLDPPGTIDQNGLFTAADRTGATFVRAIYDTIEAVAAVDVFPPDWVP